MTDEGGKRESLASISQPGARAKTRWMEDCAGERRPGCSGKKLLAACQEAAGDRKRQILAVGQFNSVPHREIDPRITLARDIAVAVVDEGDGRSEEHTSELQSLMRISYAVFCLKKKTK